MSVRKEMVGDYAAWNYFQSVDTPENAKFIAACQAKYGADKVVSDPMEAGYFGAYIWKKAVEKAGANGAEVDTNKIREAVREVGFNAPEGLVSVDKENNHTWKPVRIGKIKENGLPWERGSKPEEGTITLDFQDESSQWIVRVSDDGRGINVDRIVEKAHSKGVIDKKKVAGMSLEEKCKLIFLDGLSSAEAVTEISGRGVGMSAVSNGGHCCRCLISGCLHSCGGILTFGSDVSFPTT